LTSGHSDAQSWASECPDVKNYKWRLNPVWHRMLYSCTRMATVGVKGLNVHQGAPVFSVLKNPVHWRLHMLYKSKFYLLTYVPTNHVFPHAAKIPVTCHICSIPLSNLYLPLHSNLTPFFCYNATLSVYCNVCSVCSLFFILTLHISRVSL